MVFRLVDKTFRIKAQAGLEEALNAARTSQGRSSTQGGIDHDLKRTMAAGGADCASDTLLQETARQINLESAETYFNRELKNEYDRKIREGGSSQVHSLRALSVSASDMSTWSPLTWQPLLELLASHTESTTDLVFESMANSGVSYVFDLARNMEWADKARETEAEYHWNDLHSAWSTVWDAAVREMSIPPGQDGEYQAPIDWHGNWLRKPRDVRKGEQKFAKSFSALTKLCADELEAQRYPA